MTDIRSIRRAILGQEMAALKAECLAFDAPLRQARLGLWLRYDPDQPRVPAGSADGGQWTSGGGGGGVGAGDAGGEAGSGGDASGSVGGDSEWRTVARGVGPDGSRTETMARADGTTIRSEYATSRAAGFDEQHTVTTPDGSQRTFENARLRQTVRDELGEVLSRSEFRPDGAVLEPAFLPAVPPLVAPFIAPGTAITTQLGLVLLAGLSLRNGPDGQAVAVFNAREYVAGASGTDLTYVGRLSQADVQQACPGLGNVQNITNASAARISREGVSPSVYGTLVHTEIRDRIRRSEGTQPFLPGYFHAEHSFLKEKEAVRYGERGSVRVDVFEQPEGTATVCVYDVKTGRAGFPRGRMEEIAAHVYAHYRSPLRIILTEVRPLR